MQRSSNGSDPIRALRASRKVALDEIGEAVLALSNERVPIDEGDLHDSGSTNTFSSTSLSYGRSMVGYSDPKAVAVHEDMDSDFHAGRQAKFLETALQDSRTDIMRIAAARLRLR